jgi:hypothetical protein
MTTLGDEHDEAQIDLLTEANKEADIPSPWWVTVLYGDYGYRKTTTACSLIQERGLLLSTDHSWKVLLDPIHKDLLRKVKVVPLTGLSQLRYLDFNGYDTIIWDTISQSVDTYLDLLMDKATWGGKYREKIQTKEPELTALHTETLSLPDYRFTRDNFRPILNRLFNETSSHIVFTSQMTTPIPGMGANQQKRPSIPEATFKIIGTRADIIGEIKPQGNKFVVDVIQSLSHLGKSRISSIRGSMDQDAFVSAYKERVFK